MADVPVGAVPAPAVAPVVSKPSAPSARAAKLASVNAGLKSIIAAEVSSPAAPVSPEGGPDSSSVAQQPATPIEAKTDEAKTDEKPVEAKPDAKVVEDAPDPKTAKALAQIDKQAKKFRDEQAAARAQLEVERAEFARIKAEFTSKASSSDEISKLVRQDPIAALAKLGIDSEDDWERIARGAFVHTKTGKADPRSKPIADQTQKEREYALKLEAIEKRQAELDEQLKARDQQQQAAQFIGRYLDEAVKAIPAEPTLIGKLHAKSPEKARKALLDIGQRLERDNDGETPSHADVIAEYEATRRAELEEQGVDVDALLKPPTAAAPAKTPSRTLDVASPASGTRPVNGNPSRAEKLAAISANLRKIEAVS